MLDLQSLSFQNFINSLHADKTKEEYTRLLKEFQQYGALSSLDDLLLIEPKQLKAHIIKYLMYLKNDKKVGHSYRRGVVSALKHFFSMNDLLLNWVQISKYIGKNDQTYTDREYSYEEIEKLLEVADLKYKAIILLMCSSGIRIGAIPDMLVGDLIKTTEYDIFKVTVYRGNREEYYTFCTPECYQAITDYLEYRKRYGEVLRPESPLFREDFNRTNPGEAKQIAYYTIKTKLRDLRIKSGVATSVPVSETNKAGRRRTAVACNHGMRKFFVTQCKRAKMDMETRKLLTGHTIGVERSYIRESVEDMLSEYLKAVDFLTVSEENRLKIKVDTLQQREDEIDELSRRFEKMEEYFSKLDREP